MKYLTILLVFSFIFIGCSHNINKNLPTNVTNVKDEGNGWISFDWGQYKFLYLSDGYKNYMANAGPSNDVKAQIDILNKSLEDIIKRRESPTIIPYWDEWDKSAPKPPKESENSI